MRVLGTDVYCQSLKIRVTEEGPNKPEVENLITGANIAIVSAQSKLRPSPTAGSKYQDGIEQFSDLPSR